MASEPILSQLVTLSRLLGEPHRDLIILGEGNTSARLDDETFLVKESGKGLPEADDNSFVRVAFAKILPTLDGPALGDTEVKAALLNARVGCVGERPRPSVETFLHAYLLSLPGVNFVGHTHPTAINSVLCAKVSHEAVSGRLFPDEIVCCGPAACYVGYTDPGVTLARELRAKVEAFIDKYNMPPRVILMENHGLIATGGSARDVETSTAMAVKAARVLIGTYALGGPRFLTEATVDRIHTRPDEAYRIRLIGGK